MADTVDDIEARAIANGKVGRVSNYEKFVSDTPNDNACYIDDDEITLQVDTTSGLKHVSINKDGVNIDSGMSYMVNGSPISGGGISDAPDSKPYVRKNGAWELGMPLSADNTRRKFTAEVPGINGTGVVAFSSQEISNGKEAELELEPAKTKLSNSDTSIELSGGKVNLVSTATSPAFQVNGVDIGGGSGSDSLFPVHSLLAMSAITLRGDRSKSHYLAYMSENGTFDHITNFSFADDKSGNHGMCELTNTNSYSTTYTTFDDFTLNTPTEKEFKITNSFIQVGTDRFELKSLKLPVSGGIYVTDINDVNYEITAGALTVSAFNDFIQADTSTSTVEYLAGTYRDEMKCTIYPAPDFVKECFLVDDNTVTDPTKFDYSKVIAMYIVISDSFKPKVPLIRVDSKIVDSFTLKQEIQKYNKDPDKQLIRVDLACGVDYNDSGESGYVIVGPDTDNEKIDCVSFTGTGEQEDGYLHGAGSLSYVLKGSDGTEMFLTESFNRINIADSSLCYDFLYGDQDKIEVLATPNIADPSQDFKMSLTITYMEMSGEK